MKLHSRQESASEATPISAGSMTFLLFYDGVYPEFPGGIEHRNHQLGRALGDRGHRVILAGRAADTTSRGSGVTVRSIGPPHSLYGRSGKRSKWQAVRLAWHARRVDLSDVDVVETASVPLLHLFPLARRCRHAGIPLIVTWHEFWDGYWREYVAPNRLQLGLWRLFRWIERRAARLGDRAIAVSRMTADRVEKVRGETIEIVTNGIAADDLGAVGTGNAPGTIPLVFAGRLIEEKRVEILVEASAILADTMPGPILTIIGDGPMRAALQHRVQQLGLGDRVVMLGQLDTSSEVWDTMSNARIAVHSSAREGFGLFALEAMALGLPVIHCESGESAVREIVRHGRDGLQVSPDPESVATAVKDLLDDPAMYQSMSASARDRALGFDWDASAAALERISNELIAERSHQ